MSSGIARRVGPYLHAEGFSQEKTFENGRSFQVIVSGAFDAGGLMGPEINGIAILDKDNRCVVLDRHAMESSGYFGPSDRQKAHFKKIMELDWSVFSKFCRENPRYRGNSPDINSSAASPDAPNLQNQAIVDPSKKLVQLTNEPDIRTNDMREANANPDLKYKFPLSGRTEIIAFLANHHSYHPMNRNNGGYMLAWDIKVRGGVDYSGLNYGDPADEIDRKYDQKWSQFVESSDSVFNEACEEGLYEFTSGEWSPYPGGDSCYQFSTNGRSGGHLVLSDWPGPTPKGWGVGKMIFADKDEFIDWVLDLSDNDLAELYRAVVCLDQDLQNPHLAVSYQLSLLRKQQEDIWNDMAPAPADTETLPGMHI